MKDSTLEQSPLRAAGVLVHPTSFPGDFGVGDLGPQALHFLNWLQSVGVRVWQILPLGPVDKHGSPYQSPSTFAGNALLISPERLAEDRLLQPDELEAARCSAHDPACPVDYAVVERLKHDLLRSAFNRFLALPPEHPLRQESDQFRRTAQAWLEPYVRFMALWEHTGSSHWPSWPTPWNDGADHASSPDEGPLAAAASFYEFVQFVFDRQWRSLRNAARERGIWIVGDVPIYVSHESADVWANRHLFDLDDRGEVRHVAGVPPDYFSETGQLWGNALYQWPVLEQDRFRWWVERMQTVWEQVDLVRLDHFRGYQAYWAVPAEETTAVHGEWLPGPGPRLLEALRTAWQNLGRPTPLLPASLPFIAEDLGLITDDVIALRQQFGLPGMCVLQFALLNTDPHARLDLTKVPHDTVVYTGTHDNDTSIGWYAEQVAPSPQLREQWDNLTDDTDVDVPWQLMRLAWHTPAILAVAPMQDILSLGSEARLNTPGTDSNNWIWRFGWHQLHDSITTRFQMLNQTSGRWPQ